MNLANVMDELGDALDEIDGLRVSRFWPDGIAPPAAIVGLPDGIELETAYAQGIAEMVIPIILLVGQVSDRSAAAEIAAYASGSGAKSVKVAVDTYAGYTALHVATVKHCEFDVIPFEGVDYLACVFDTEIVGSGT